MTLQEIESLTLTFARGHDHLAEVAVRLQREIESLKARFMPDIRQAASAAGDARTALHAAIKAAPELFQRPRTRTLHGVRVGYGKQRGQVEIDDEAAVIARMRKLLPPEQTEMLIRVRESVHRPAVYDLIAADLKHLGIRIVADSDAVYIKPVDSGIDRLVSALLKGADEISPGMATLDGQPG